MKITTPPSVIRLTSTGLQRILAAAVLAETGRELDYISAVEVNTQHAIGQTAVQHLVDLTLVLKDPT